MSDAKTKAWQQYFKRLLKKNVPITRGHQTDWEAGYDAALKQTEKVIDYVLNPKGYYAKEIKKRLREGDE